MKPTQKKKQIVKKGKQVVYLAHPFAMRNHPDKWKIVDELKSRGLIVIDPFEREEKLVQSYGIEKYWDRPNWYLAREMWTKDLQAVFNSDFILAWIPTYEAIGTAKEMTYAYMLYELTDKMIFIQVISPLLHPAFAVEAHQQFLTVEDFIKRKPYRWEVIKKTKL